MHGGEQKVWELTSIPVATLRTWRVRGGGPPYYKVNRSVLYDLDEVIAWVRARRALSTTDADQKAREAERPAAIKENPASL